MLQFFALFAALNAPAAKVPTEPGPGCVSWTQKAHTDAKQTAACVTHFLTLAYGERPTEEALSLDPTYGQTWEPSVSTAQLEMAIKHTRASWFGECTDTSRCGRAVEFFEGLIARKRSTFENLNIGSFEGLLATVLAGKPVKKADFMDGEGRLGYSALTLWKLRNAAYARHGYQFKHPDLNAFFYGPRTEAKGALPLPAGTTKAVKLTAVDGANVRLIKALEAQLK